MLKISKESKLKSEEAVKQAVAFFGPTGYGLEVNDMGNCCVNFTGGGGHIYVTARDSKKGSMVDIETVEWDYPVEDFLRKLK